MNEKRCRNILKTIITEKGTLSNDNPRVLWPSLNGDIALNGLFSVKALEAIVWWVNYKKMTNSD